jgi:chromosome partitioning protein
MPAKILTLAIQKGGSGKTTNTVNIAHTMAYKKYRVLLVDMDPQASLSNWYGHSEFEEDNNVFTLIDKNNAVPFNVAKNVDMIRGSFELQSIENMVLPLNYLRIALEPFMNDYDYIIIDTPPAIGNSTKVSIFASDKTFVPIQATPLAFRGIRSILTTIELVESTDKKDRLGGIFLCCTNAKQNLTKLIKESLETKYQPFNLKTNIRMSVDVASSMLAQQSVLEFSPLSMAKLDYQALTDEIIDALNNIKTEPPKPRITHIYSRPSTNTQQVNNK